MGAPEDTVLKIVERMESTERQMQDVTVVMHKRERVDGKMTERRQAQGPRGALVVDLGKRWAHRQRLQPSQSSV